jgi:preprotein translocase subunit SecD
MTSDSVKKIVYDYLENYIKEHPDLDEEICAQSIASFYRDYWDYIMHSINIDKLMDAFIQKLNSEDVKGGRDVKGGEHGKIEEEPEQKPKDADSSVQKSNDAEEKKEGNTGTISNIVDGSEEKGNESDSDDTDDESDNANYKKTKSNPTEESDYVKLNKFMVNNVILKNMMVDALQVICMDEMKAEIVELVEDRITSDIGKMKTGVFIDKIIKAALNNPKLSTVLKVVKKRQEAKSQGGKKTKKKRL